MKMRNNIKLQVALLFLFFVLLNWSNQIISALIAIKNIFVISALLVIFTHFIYWKILRRVSIPQFKSGWNFLRVVLVVAVILTFILQWQSFKSGFYDGLYKGLNKNRESKISLNCVILGYNAEDKGEYEQFSNALIGIYSPLRKKFLTLGEAESASEDVDAEIFTFEEAIELLDKGALLPQWIESSENRTYWARPLKTVKVATEDVIRSNQYSSGYKLINAVITGVNKDSNPMDTTSLEEIDSYVEKTR